MTQDSLEHGTSRGYRRHRQNPKKYGDPCQACKSAHAREASAYRMSRGPAANNRARRVRSRALALMAEENPSLFAQYRQRAENEMVEMEQEQAG